MSTPRDQLTSTLARLLGARVRELRKARKLTTTELAARARTHRPIVSRVERGAHMPDWWTLAELARGLEVSMRELLLGIDWEQVDNVARQTLRSVA